MTRNAQQLATEMFSRARIIELRQLAQRTAELYDQLLAHCVPPETARLHFRVQWLRARIEEEATRQLKPSAGTGFNGAAGAPRKR
jgi:hypothetical protein